jgi:hypothetical protein
MADPRGVAPVEVKPGLMVRYQPTLGGPKYVGLVAEEPWQLGQGTWVTHLCSMEPAYGADTGRPGRTTVKAAALTHLEVIGG